MDVKAFLQSKNFSRILWGLGVAVAVIAVFQAGVFVGFRKAGFSYRLGDNYYRAFDGGRRGGPVPGLRPGEFPDAHGAAGRIVKIDPPTFVMEGDDRLERIVVMNDDTVIRRFRDTIAPGDLQPDDYVVVIGSPDDQSRISAKLIRVLPPPDFNRGAGLPF